MVCLLAFGLPACSGPAVGPADADFELSSPSNDAIGVAATPTFTWLPSIGTATYALEVSTDPGLAAPVISQTGIAATSFTPAAPLSDGTVYYWRVVAERATGDVNATGSPWSFTTVAPVPGAFTMVSPTNGSTTVPTTPSFSWTSSLGAASYRLQVSSDVAFVSLAVDQGGLLTTSATPAVTLTSSTVYFWRVIAESTSNTTATGAPWAFTTAAGPGSFTQVAPTNAATGVSTLPTFSWNPSTGATSYRLQVSTDFNFTTVTIDQSGINALFFTPTTALQGATVYYWKVTAVGPSGSTTASPSPLFFTTS